MLFYGSFLELHGVDIIVKAALACADLDVKWVLLGNGPCKKGLEKLAGKNPQIVFESPVSYSLLPARIAKADILLGVLERLLNPIL